MRISRSGLRVPPMTISSRLLRGHDAEGPRRRRRDDAAHRDEVWIEGKPGHLWVFEDGALEATLGS
jgi:hypothetical protein